VVRGRTQARVPSRAGILMGSVSLKGGRRSGSRGDCVFSQGRMGVGCVQGLSRGGVLFLGSVIGVAGALGWPDCAAG